MRLETRSSRRSAIRSRVPTKGHKHATSHARNAKSDAGRISRQLHSRNHGTFRTSRAASLTIPSTDANFTAASSRVKIERSTRRNPSIIRREGSANSPNHRVSDERTRVATRLVNNRPEPATRRRLGAHQLRLNRQIIGRTAVQERRIPAKRMP